MSFELLKLMVKDTIDGDVRFFSAGVWYEFRPSNGSPDTPQQWFDAISRQRQALYAQKKGDAGLLSPRKLSSPDDTEQMARQHYAGARKQFLLQSDNRESKDAFSNVSEKVMRVRVETVAKRIDVLSLEYHRASLQCAVVSNNIDEYNKSMAQLMEKYDELVRRRQSLWPAPSPRPSGTTWSGFS